MAQFDVYSTSVQNIISWIKSGEIAIPEIQRPFVWDSSKVRVLLDSLYKGFPIGYIIVWKNPDVRLKDGTISIGKKILIDGQQRITTLQTAIAGMLVTDANYKRKPIRIAFNPLTEAFEVLNPAIEKDCKWIPDISKVFEPTFEEFQFIIQYCKDNDLSGQEGAVSNVISKLKKVLDISLGVTDLNQGISVNEVTDIFIRINSQGVVLSQADFAMSKISADDKYGGNEIRKMIDYFCHFMQRPADYEMIAENNFSKTDVMQKIKWVVRETEDIYVPSYTDVLRVSFTHKFKRGKISDLVSLLTGRYSGSAESAIDYDIKRFTEQDPIQFIKNTEAGELSDAFWNSVPVTRLDTSVASSPYFLVFLMAQVKAGSRYSNRIIWIR